MYSVVSHICQQVYILAFCQTSTLTTHNEGACERTPMSGFLGEYRGCQGSSGARLRSCKTHELEYWPDALGHAQHHTIQASFVAAALRVRSCGGTLQCEQCRAFGSGAGKSWLRSAGSRPAALNARGRRPGGSRRTTLNRPARRGSGARPSGIAATASGGGAQYAHKLLLEYSKHHPCIN